MSTMSLFAAIVSRAARRRPTALQRRRMLPEGPADEGPLRLRPQLLRRGRLLAAGGVCSGGLSPPRGVLHGGEWCLQ
jgi:hypothetical protein